MSVYSAGVGCPAPGTMALPLKSSSIAATALSASATRYAHAGIYPVAHDNASLARVSISDSAVDCAATSADCHFEVKSGGCTQASPSGMPPWL